MDNKKLKEFCNSIGIKCVGIAGIGPYDNLEKIIKNKLINGHFTGMEEAIVENRIDPRKTMDNVKSIIVCAFPYYVGENEKSNLSKYCQVRDYHIVVKEYLQKICDHIESRVENFEYKIFADNGPLVDRHLAYLAGIGYFGINNNIITDEYGSYIFIGYIMSNYEFKTDEPLPRTCIKCGKCVKYCPGNALLGNYEMNPRRCLSYMTQKKGELSEEEITLINKNKKVFGCDICQEVCPHNKKIPITDLEEFRENVIDELNYEEINSISNKEFKRRYSDRAFNWRGRPLIKRNMEIILEKPIE